jgi:hypothetical protein
MKYKIATITLALFTMLSPMLVAQESKQIILSHYIFPEFTEGYVTLKGARTQQMLLNYNSATEEMVFKRGETILAISKEELKEVESVNISDRKFILIKDKFFEVVFEGNTSVYAEHRCTVIPPGNPAPYGGTSQVSSVDRYSGISANGGLYYKMQLPDGYKVSPVLSYIVKQGDKSTKVYGLKVFRRAYADKKEEFDKYIKSNKVKFDNLKDVAAMAKALD